ncbi:hypothetical protein AVEN_135157-1 [Araneus ventricosus]|uniref:Uncharacterized protein n=1 Tax=Araneus ventricosus TaxID=182803 RepID=A0A4Y2KA38_ARAVE|nr:hypothetical protein AVEN_135157-1 [Araneus ventricosus]
MLYLLVELALPEVLIKEWERTRSRVENKDRTKILGNLLEFLRSEVESEERLQFARSGSAKDQEFLRFKLKDEIATAACIVSSEMKRAEKNDMQRLFCNKSFQNTSEGFKAADMSTEEKTETLKEKDACVVCLKSGHKSAYCIQEKSLQHYVSKYKSYKKRISHETANVKYQENQMEF